jgi:hypothetical protein
VTIDFEKNIRKDQTIQAGFKNEFKDGPAIYLNRIGSKQTLNSEKASGSRISNEQFPTQL